MANSTAGVESAKTSTTATLEAMLQDLAELKDYRATMEREVQTIERHHGSGDHSRAQYLIAAAQERYVFGPAVLAVVQQEEAIARHIEQRGCQAAVVGGQLVLVDRRDDAEPNESPRIRLVDLDEVLGWPQRGWMGGAL